MNLTKSIQYSLTFVCLLWLITLLDFLIPLDFTTLGVYPRSVTGLIGIPLAVFLHGGFSHVAANTIPLLILTSTLLMFYSRIALISMFYMIIFSNTIVWVMGRSAYHVGASGLVYALATFIIAAGFYHRKPFSIFLALFIGFIYGGLVWGVVPGLVDWDVSWEGHLAGAVVGVYLAKFYRYKT
ncbi:MAG: rhomboid family intramembrane serine protease [Leptospira sp.]|nr:rhomboid family intramembrane serine protease [Leptospira sp.]